MTRSTRVAYIVVAAAAIAAVVAAKTVARSTASTEAPSVSSAVPKIPRLVDVGAGTCIPCKAMAPILEDLRKEYAGRLEVQFIDVWQQPAAARPFNIHMIPTQIFFAADGAELARHEGFIGRDEILAKWKELGVTL